jgi:hypothetical protein
LAGSAAEDAAVTNMAIASEAAKFRAVGGKRRGMRETPREKAKAGGRTGGGRDARRESEFTL